MLTFYYLEKKSANLYNLEKEISEEYKDSPAKYFLRSTIKEELQSYNTLSVSSFPVLIIYSQLLDIHFFFYNAHMNLRNFYNP